MVWHTAKATQHFACLGKLVYELVVTEAAPRCSGLRDNAWKRLSNAENAVQGVYETPEIRCAASLLRRVSRGRKLGSWTWALRQFDPGNVAKGPGVEKAHAMRLQGGKVGDFYAPPSIKV